ncbi:phosphotransferase [Marilutibacter maris]|uniref:Phosphotransferase n=1 Tax=Marilutibacter maris TaxID=1605891 RepID=A0A2U9T0Z7_9GAMM|nr:phosphotransferase [Lysobacter maris]AWV06021.1 phosphotransferase [Lysobacter maris]
MSADAPLLDRADILGLVPHQGAMCLWNAVLAWDAERIRVRADSHRDPAHPLRRHGRLGAVHLCEYGAQAMAVHGGLLAADAPPRAGLLVALRGVALSLARIDDLPGPLIGEAERLADSAAGQLYGFRILHDGRTIAQGRAMVALGGAVD